MKTGTDVGRGCRFQADRACICARRLSVTCRFVRRLAQMKEKAADLAGLDSGSVPGGP